MPCPRCQTSLIVPVMLVDEEAEIKALKCTTCSWIFGEELLDYHHGLPMPPEPRPDVRTPVWDRERRLLRWEPEPPTSPVPGASSTTP